jgi:eukaryotic-like serine/threonine-protein kinase
MTADAGYSWDEADRLFDQALELAPAERERWLAQRCAGDTALREQVEALLRADAVAEHFLQLDGWRLAEPLLEPPEAAADRVIGPYRLKRELARGGMGVVYLAERADGQFEQRVALKLIKRGMDSDEIHRRFLAERQILARLSHPHIARLLDGGVSAEGQPFFAIEYVEGSTILDHCESRRMGPDDRLRLFLDVCDAVRYAHQNLVIHRDLKPSNILVTPDGQVKLLDFGIAKLLADGTDAETGLTRTGLRVMTPEYAAPEQVMGAAVTTATDVYALGALLYELVSGHRAHRLVTRSLAEVERVVCEVDPVPPSAAAPAPFRPALRGDIDTITLTALQKRPDRRYATVEQLAGDVRRHLEGRPVAARPDTWRYRAAKFVGRHRIGVAAGAAIALSLVAGLVGTVWQARVAADRAVTAAAEAAKERAVRAFLVQLFQASNPMHTRGRDVTARELLDQGRRDLDTALAAQPSVRAQLLTVVATAYASLGLVRQADTLFDQAVTLGRSLPDDADEQVVEALTGWAANLVVQANYGRAEPLLREAIHRVRSRDSADPRAAAPLRALGRVHTYTNRPAQAEALLREALAIDLHAHGAESWQAADGYDVLGFQLLRQGDVDGADSAISLALAIQRKLLGPDHPEQFWTMGSLAHVRRAQSNDAEAERLLRQVVAGQQRIYPKGHSQLARSLHELGQLLADNGRYAQAESLIGPQVMVHRALLGPDNDHALGLLEDLAGFRLDQGRFAAAERDLREVVTAWRRVLGPDHRYTLAATERLSLCLREQGRYADAEALSRETLAVRRTLRGGAQPGIVRSLLSIGTLKRLSGQPDEAERLFRDALAIGRAALPEAREETGQALGALGTVLNQRGRPAEAEPLLRESLTLTTGPREVSSVRRDLGHALLLQRRHAEAEALLLQAHGDLGARPDYWSRKEQRETLRLLVELYRSAGQLDKAAAYQSQLR